MHCVVLAGGTPRPTEPLFAETAGRPKALLEIGGRPMVQWVLDALAGSGAIEQVVLVGLDEEAGLSFPGELELIPGRGTLAENLFAGIERLLEIDPDSHRAAYCWSDIPLATGEMIRQFLDQAAVAGPDAHVVAGLVRREDLEPRYEGLREQWLKVREGSFIAADFGVFDPGKAELVRGPLEVLTGQRKNALRQAGTVGIGLMVRYLLRRLTLPGLERTLWRRYGIRARLIVATDPELGLDVDGPENLAVCRQAVADRVPKVKELPGSGVER